MSVPISARGTLPVGWRRTIDVGMAYICLRHPDRLLCDAPQNSAVSYGRANQHMATDHAELPALCFTCGQPISEDDAVPVFAVETLRQPLTVYNSHDRTFQNRSELQTLPITHLRQRHRDQIDLSLRVAPHIV